MAVARRQFTVGEYQRMAETGILREDDRVELIDGEIIEMSPIGSRHVACVIRLTTHLAQQVGQAALLSVQNPIQLSDYSEPQPDLALLHPRSDGYAAALPAPADVLLIVEVADTSLAYDQDIKVPRYAQAGIPEVWLVDLERERVIVYTQPGASGYRLMRELGKGEVITATMVAGIVIAVDDIL